MIKGENNCEVFLWIDGFLEYRPPERILACNACCQQQDFMEQLFQSVDFRTNERSL